MGRKNTILIMALVFLAGLFLFLIPILNGIVVNTQIEGEAEAFLGRVEISLAPEPVEETALKEMPYQALWNDTNQYNLDLFDQHKRTLQSPRDYEKPSFLLADYGVDSEVFAVISIPALELEMPVFLGASKENMAKGAVHLSQTSLPIGGGNTNCVIAGHRGYGGASYFRYVPDLQKGDTVTVTNLWETLTYSVVETKIIAPNDVDAIRIQEGRELLTLLTCHPYASGGRQRFLVICERTD